MSDWKKVEALLFASGRYLSEEQISEMTEIPKNKVKKAMSALVKHYEEIDSSLKIFEEDGFWKMNPKEEFSNIVQRVVSEAELPRPVMETLAVIAYKNPVLQSEVKEIRGSGIYDHIQLLEDKGYVLKERFGRTYKLKLTEKFFEYFDVEGEKDIKALFKDVKKPDVKKLGELEVYKSNESDNGFTEQIVERMKKLETSTQEEKAQDNFLNDFESKLETKKASIDEAEKEIDEMKPKVEESGEEAPLEEDSSEVIEDGGEEAKVVEENAEDSEKDEFSDDGEDSEDTDDLEDNKVEDNEDVEVAEEPEEEQTEEVDQPKQDDKKYDDKKKDFLKKINEEIEDIVEDGEINEDTKDKK